MSTHVTLIAAVDRGGVIGKNNQLPWHMPGDLRHFRKLTVHKPVVMGRKTYESMGKPLPHRPNIVLSRDPAYRAPGCETVTTLDEALARGAAHGSEVMVLGGGAVFIDALPKADRIYLTVIDARFDGDAFFPPIPADAFRVTAREHHQADAANPHDYYFVWLERAAPAAAPGAPSPTFTWDALAGITE